MKHTCMKKIMAVVLVIIMALSLPACGNKNGTGKKVKTASLSKYIDKIDMQIWYIASKVDKEADYDALIIKDGKVAYVSSGVTGESKYPHLGDVAQAKEKEVYDALIEARAVDIENTIKEIESRDEQYYIDYYGEEKCEEEREADLELVKKYQAVDTSDLEFYDYMLAVETDATGNNTVNEKMFYFYGAEIERYYMDYVTFYPANAGPKTTELISYPAQIYNQSFLAVNVAYEEDYYDGVLLIRDGVEDSIAVDEPDAKNIVVDKDKSELREMYLEKLGLVTETEDETEAE
ncbi:MAG: hypothetical protein NC124_03535 [Clostridium sp.]|nr:hypothetical protein [Clostridium sp.]